MKLLNRLTWSSSSGALPKCVLEGDFCQVLSHFFSLICDKGELGRRICIKLTIKTTFNHKIRHSNLSQYTSEEFTQVRFAFVQGGFPIFVTDAHLSPISYKILKENWKSE